MPVGRPPALTARVIYASHASTYVGVDRGRLDCMAGCSDDLAENPLELTRRDPVPAGPQCPYGGAQFSTGRDLNDDGVLEDDEVRSVSYTCSDPAPTLTRDRVLDSSLTCPAGGIATESGVDDDRDGSSKITRST